VEYTASMQMVNNVYSS